MNPKEDNVVMFNKVIHQQICIVIQNIKKMTEVMDRISEIKIFKSDYDLKPGNIINNENSTSLGPQNSSEDLKTS